MFELLRTIELFYKSMFQAENQRHYPFLDTVLNYKENFIKYKFWQKDMTNLAVFNLYL